MARLARSGEILVAVAAFGVLCAVALSFGPRYSEPDDYAYRASVIAITHGHLMTLSGPQVNALAAELTGDARGGGGGGIGPARIGPPIPQWVQLADGRWISEKDPGYPYLAVPFQLAGLIRLAPLFYGALGCLGLFIGARRWLGRYGGAAAVGLFCSSGAALLFAWRDYMPTFTEASLIAGGSGMLLWAVLAGEATARRRTWAGLLGFAALAAAVFLRYTNVVVLGCVVVAVLAAWRLPAARLPGVAVAWWLGTVALAGAGIAVFNTAAYGGPLRTGYPPGQVTFSLTAVLPNLRYLPGHLITAMPMLLLALVAGGWIAVRRARPDRTADTRRDFAVALALGAVWLSAWGLYAAYTWTTHPLLTTLQVVRFYVPAIGIISLLGAWLLVKLPVRAPVAAVASTVAIAILFGLGIWSFDSMRGFGPDDQRNCAPGPPGAGPPAPGGGLPGDVQQPGRGLQCAVHSVQRHRPG